MGDNWRKDEDVLILYCEPKVNNKFLQKIILKLFGWEFLYKQKFKLKNGIPTESLDE